MARSYPSSGKVIGMLALIFVLTTPANAASRPVCGLTKLQEVEVKTSTSQGLLVLSDGRSIRLAGVHFLQDQQPQADFGQLSRVFISLATKSPDRYGRWPAYVYLGSDKLEEHKMLQIDWLRRGLLLARPRGRSVRCSEYLLAAENTGRQAKTGLWANASNWISRANDKNLALKAGRFQIVEGRVLSVGETGRTLYLNFGEYWKRDFTVTVAKRDAKRFKGKISYFKSLAGRKVRVRGWMQARDGALIRVSHTGQIELAAD